MLLLLWLVLVVRREKKKDDILVGCKFLLCVSVFIVCCLYAYVLTSHARIYDMRQRCVFCDFLAV